MTLAIVVYFLIYVGLISYLRANAEDMRLFCEAIPADTRVVAFSAEAEGAGYTVTVSPASPGAASALFISKPDETDAVCHCAVRDERIISSRFILKWF